MKIVFTLFEKAFKLIQQVCQLTAARSGERLPLIYHAPAKTVHLRVAAMQPAVNTSYTSLSPKQELLMNTTRRNRYVVAVSAILALSVLAPRVSSAQVTQLTGWTNAYNITGAGLSGTGTNFPVPLGSNRILVVAIATTSGGSPGTVGDPTTITYGGTTLTRATGNGGSNGRMHTWLYFLKDNAVMDNTAKQLAVTMGNATATNVAFAVWYTVYSGVDQTPSSYTTGDGFNSTSSNGPASLSANMSIGANQQALAITNVFNANLATVPTLSTPANWSSSDSTSGTGTGLAWKFRVGKRTIPGSAANDNISTAITPAATNYRWAMSAMSLPQANVPVLAITGTTSHGSACLGTQATTLTYTISNTGPASAAGVTVSSNSSEFVVSNLSSTTIASGGSATFQVTFSPSTAGARNATITVNSTSAGSNSPTIALSGTGNGLPVTSVVGQSDANCFAGSDGSITIGVTGGLSPYFYSVDNGLNWTLAANPAPHVFGGLSANIPYRIRVKDSNGCLSK